MNLRDLMEDSKDGLAIFSLCNFLDLVTSRIKQNAK